MALIIRNYSSATGLLPWLWWVLAILYGFYTIQYLYIKLGKRPVLTINEAYIFDDLSNIKYYWNDISEVVETNDYLSIHLYQPTKYLYKIYNPLRWLVAVVTLGFFEKSSPYDIRLHMLDIPNRIEFLEALNKFSIAAEANA